MAYYLTWRGIGDQVNVPELDCNLDKNIEKEVAEWQYNIAMGLDGKHEKHPSIEGRSVSIPASPSLPESFVVPKKIRER